MFDPEKLTVNLFNQTKEEFMVQRVKTIGDENSCMLASIVQSACVHFRCMEDIFHAIVISELRAILCVAPLNLSEIEQSLICNPQMLYDETLLLLAHLFGICIILFAQMSQNATTPTLPKEYLLKGYGTNLEFVNCSYRRSNETESIDITLPRRMIFLHHSGIHYESMIVMNQMSITPEIFKTLNFNQQEKFALLLESAKASEFFAKLNDSVASLRM